jgi:hypothetical protein
MPKIFHDLDLTNFWKDSDYAQKSYVEDRPTPQLIKEIEAELGFKLPASYLELMQSQNGGVPLNRCFPTSEPTCWAEDHIQLKGSGASGAKKRIRSAAIWAVNSCRKNGAIPSGGSVLALALPGAMTW